MNMVCNSTFKTWVSKSASLISRSAAILFAWRELDWKKIWRWDGVLTNIFACLGLKHILGATWLEPNAAFWATVVCAMISMFSVLLFIRCEKSVPYSNGLPEYILIWIWWRGDEWMILCFAFFYFWFSSECTSINWFIASLILIEITDIDSLPIPDLNSWNIDHSTFDQECSAPHTPPSLR